MRWRGRVRDDAFSFASWVGLMVLKVGRVEEGRLIPSIHGQGEDRCDLTLRIYLTSNISQ